jgi:hypothetical protein
MIYMTLIEFYDKARAIATEHGFAKASLSASAGIHNYEHSGKSQNQYHCSIFVPNCAIAGPFDTPEKALAKLDLICKEANIAKMEGGTEVDGIDAPIVENAAPVGDIEATKEESEVVE